MDSIFISVVPIYEDIELPVYSTKESACFDIKAYLNPKYIKQITYYDENNNKCLYDNVNGQVVLNKFYRYMIPTGLIFYIPKNYSIRLHPRSGLSLKKGVTLVNCEGIIDSDYHLEVFIPLTNLSNEDYVVKNGERICQGEVISLLRADWVVYGRRIEGQGGNSPKERVGGFGSTG